MLLTNKPDTRPRRMIRFVMMISLSAHPRSIPAALPRTVIHRRLAEIDGRQNYLASVIGRKTGRIEKIVRIAGV